MALLLPALMALAQDAERIDEAFERIRPADAELGVFQLDWADSLQEAKDRAARERRPIFLLVIRNSFGDVHSGHC